MKGLLLRFRLLGVGWVICFRYRSLFVMKHSGLTLHLSFRPI